MDRQRLVFGEGLRDRFGIARFQLLKPQFELLNLPDQPLLGVAKLRPAQPGDLEFEFFDFQGAQLNGGLCRLRRRGRCCRPPPIRRLDQQGPLRRRQCHRALEKRWGDEFAAFKPFREKALTS
jgi:hypothetical protein